MFPGGSDFVSNFRIVSKPSRMILTLYDFCLDQICGKLLQSCPRMVCSPNYEQISVRLDGHFAKVFLPTLSFFNL